MKNLLLTLLLTLAVGAASFGAFYLLNREPAALRQAAREGDARLWLRAEFHLDDAHFAAIRSLHEQYLRVCAGHCAAILDAQRHQAPPAEIAALEANCVRSMTDHFHRVAALMPPAEGARYLAIVLPRVADYDHRGAPTLEGSH
jgi:hypothetical protein